MAYPGQTSLGPLHLSEDAERGIGLFAMNRTWALTIILCCLIITGGFAWTSRGHADTLQAYATKVELHKAIEDERAVYTETLKEMREALTRIEQRLYELASKTK